MRLSSIFADQFELHQDDVVLDVLKKQGLFLLVISEVFLSQLASQKNFIFLVCFTEYLVDLLDVFNQHKLWYSLSFKALIFQPVFFG